MERWYALHTKPRKERFVRDLLECRGIEAYLPMLAAAGKRRAGKDAEQPFFARYLFFRADLLRVPVSSVNWMPGVTRVVSFGGQPTVVQDQVIQWLRARLAQMNAESRHAAAPLRPNDRVKVTGGPLRDMEAIFDRHLSSEGRARVLIDMLGRQVACQIELEYLERIP